MPDEVSPLDRARAQELERRLRRLLISINPDPGTAIYVLGKLFVVALAQLPADEDANVLDALTGDIANMRTGQQQPPTVPPRVTLN